MLRIAFDDTVSATLEAIGRLAAPVLRSCHIGNNGSYNFGWLALAGNTRLCMYDHTTYGADRVCHPWLVVGDRGRILRAFGVDGMTRPELQGLHVSAPEVAVPVKHRSILNFGLAAHIDGIPLVTWHHDRNRRLALAVNGSLSTFDAKQMQIHFALLTRITEFFAARGRLDVLFDRWVTVRRGRVMLMRIGQLVVEAGTVSIWGTDGALLFGGTLAAMLTSLESGLASVVQRVTTGSTADRLDYPWIRLGVAYLFGAACEFASDAGQRRFYHAGGLTSPYYMDEAPFRAQFTQAETLLVEGGFLPFGVEFVVVPIGACQFFARSGAASLLDDLLATAVAVLRAHALPQAVSRALRLLALSGASGAAPQPPLLAGLDASACESLRQLTLAFNEIDPNTLPSCLRVGDFNGFTRYGADGLGAGAVESGVKLHFPALLRELSWGEAEWILQVLGELHAGEPEAAVRRADESVPH